MTAVAVAALWASSCGAGTSSGSPSATPAPIRASSDSQANRQAAAGDHVAPVPVAARPAPVSIDAPAAEGSGGAASVAIALSTSGLDARFIDSVGRERGRWTVAPGTSGTELAQLIGPTVGRADSPRVTLFVDGRVTYGDVIAWMDALRQLGWTDVSFGVTRAD